MVEKCDTPADRLTAALGRGLIAGLVGTAAMTVSSTTEAKLNGRAASTTPAQAAGKVAGVIPRDEAGERRFNTLAHWGYGTAWGVFRGMLDVAGLRGPLASLVHFVAVLGAEQAMLPALGVGSPTPSYGAKAAGIDALHHAVYAGTTGAAYDYLQRR
ncbi:MAG: hypothetical protein ACRDTA_12005 [Pseudonocardiaceae bacterium]